MLEVRIGNCLKLIHVVILNAMYTDNRVDVKMCSTNSDETVTKQ